MFKNYFLIAIRNFKKDKTNTLISLSGLIVGLTCVMLIVGYIRYETLFDTNYSNAERIYQVVDEHKDEIGFSETASVPFPLGPTLLREMPEVQAQTSLNYYEASFINNKNAVQKINYVGVDSSFFSIFNFKFKYGNAATAFKNAHSIVLTEQAAQNLFGKRLAIGNVLYLTKSSYSIDSGGYTVTGIIQNIPKNTFFKAEVFISLPASKETLNYMGYTSGSACIMLGKNNTIQQVKNHLNALYKKYEFDGTKLSFIPVQKIHLYSADIKDFPDNYNIGNIKYVYIYASIALLILLIGCANFINLTIARSLERTKEIGIRKVLGAKRKQLIIQFIGESSLFFAIALPLALILSVYCWKSFTNLLDIEAAVSFLFNSSTLFIFIGICAISSLLCSLYPALFLSKLNPVHTLKGGNYRGLTMNLGLRKFLIVLQFSISIILIITTIIVHEQLSYLNNQNLGFNKSNLLVLDWNDYGQKESSFKNELLRNPNISAASISRLNIAKSYGENWSAKDPADSSKTLHYGLFLTDADFVKTFQIPIIEGKEFAKMYLSTIPKLDSSAKISTIPILASSAFIKALNIQNPIGKILHQETMSGNESQIIGVIDDFKGISLKEENPLICIQISPKPIRYGYAYIKISGTNTQSTTRYIKNTWKQFFPEKSFDFSFVNDRIAHLYDSEIRLTSLFNIFALLAIVISCTGLFSLVSLMVRKRTKEIGIRKVLGASVPGITKLLTKDFFKMVILSIIIASPIAWWLMNKWLMDFPYRIQINWWVFAVAGAVVIVIALLTIGFQSIKAAKSNPVESLRNE